MTRLLSRLGKGALTGIDRVELAYLEGLLGQEKPVFGLARSPAGVLLLSETSLGEVLGWAKGATLPTRVDLIGRIGRKGQPILAAVEARLRRAAIARAPIFLAGRMLRRHLPIGAVYLNVGHANLSDRILQVLRNGAELKVVVMLHDTIPLDFPQYARADQVKVFQRRVAAISAHADLVLHTANATRAANEQQLARCGRVPPGLVAPLGVTLAEPDFAQVPKEIDLSPGYFVALGTIEPRKNHALLLDVWERFASAGKSGPRLVILGNRGWADPSLFTRLDKGVPGVTVHSGLSDAAVAAVLSRSSGLLFPTFAEGFGLPALEAARLGVPVICSDLPILREILGIDAIYLTPSDIYSWERTILDRFLLGRNEVETVEKSGFFTWSEHLRIVLTGF
ncbi:glycosyltransferase family 4 protein [Thioclava sp. FR2]|uniref:glycosyltransferase family 4 protein n=1 Tax=Thioclava sp. FR2 TaxID=3445780 RepID=UPI003EBDBC55